MIIDCPLYFGFEVAHHSRNVVEQNHLPHDLAAKESKGGAKVPQPLLGKAPNNLLTFY